MLKEVFYFIIFVPGSLLVWTLSMNLGPGDFPQTVARVFNMELKALLITLVPYLVFQFIRGIAGGFSRKLTRY